MMDELDLIYSLNTQYSETDLIPVLDVVNEVNTSKEEIRAFAEALDINEKKIYFTEDRIPYYFYYDYPIYFEIYELEPSNDQLLNLYSERINRLQKVYKEKDWAIYLNAIKGAMSTTIFTKLFPELEKNEQYKFLRHIYVTEDQGHNLITQEMWKEALDNQPENYQVELPYDKDVYTVYRGIGSKSSALEHTLSWSLNLSTAIKFSFRGKSDSIIYKAKVKKEEIIDYFDDRGESEVIIAPSSIYDLEEIKQYDGMSLYIELFENGIIDEFNFYKNTFINSNNFLFHSDLHGIKHTTRVLLFVLSLSFLHELDVRDRAILANAAIYHDIGRKNNDKDIGHGQRSSELIDSENHDLIIIDCQNKSEYEEYRLDILTSKEMNIIKSIIENHELNDQEGLKDTKLSEWSSKDKARYQRLYLIFKDADGLDRLRLEDINDEYFRTKYTKHLLNFSHLLLTKLL